MAEVLSRPEVAADLHGLASLRLRARAFALIDALQTQPELGLPLDTHTLTGDLSDCRKRYFDERVDRSPRYRIVYRVYQRQKREVVEVIAVGRRIDESVYHAAVDRLERESG